jgi:antitoxin CptB
VSESGEARLKRMKMRSWRRGTKEMDMILGPYGDDALGAMSDRELHIYDQLLSENDQDLYQWVTGQGTAPKVFDDLLDTIRDHAGVAKKPGGPVA